MKKYLLFLLLPLFSLNAQDSAVTHHSENGFHSTRVISPDYQIRQLADDISIIFPKKQPIADKNKDNYNLKITIDGYWGVLAFGNGVDFRDIIYRSDIQSDTIELTVPEGSYDFCLWCSADTVHYAFVTQEQFLVESDTEIVLRAADAVHKVDFAPVDETGRSFVGDPSKYYSTELILRMHPSVAIFFQMNFSSNSVENNAVYVNDMGKRCALISALYGFLLDGDYEYCIKLPTIYDGLSKDTILSNRPEDFVLHRQMFHLEGQKDAFSKGYAFSIIGNNNFATMVISYRHNRMVDSSEPYQLYTNSRLDGRERDANVFFAPMAVLDIVEMDLIHLPYIAAAPVIVSEEGKIVKDDFLFPNNLMDPCTEDYWEIFSRMNILKQYDPEDIIYNGYRTPALCYQGYNTDSYLAGTFLFLGENNEHRFVDTDRLLEVKHDGETIYFDTLAFFQRFPSSITPGIITMNVVNDNVFAYGRKMVNRSDIMFGLTQSDLNPPTLTMLRIVDEDGDIRIGIEDLETATMEIAAGDFDIKWGIQYYQAKPEIDISWSIDGEIFYPLQAVEDETKFHKSCGNFFTVDLASLKNYDVQNRWITVKITLTDEAGNYINQVLEPLFYCGNPLGIENLSAGAIKHSVFPNPFTEIMAVELEKPLRESAYFEVYDLTGRIVHQQKISKQTSSFSWNGNHLKGGVYFYAIYSEEGSARGKVIKQ